MPQTSHRLGTCRPSLAVLAAVLLVSACAAPSVVPEPGALAPAERAAAGAQKGTAAETDIAPLAAAHKAKPADAAAALAYSKALRSTGAAPEAVAVLDQAAAANPSHRRLQLERGLLALELGDAAKAETLLRQAHDPKAPDWRLHSALGAALASRGRQQQAQVQFAKALALAPDHPSVLNNLALSYTLDGKVDEAEKLLRKAQRNAAKPVQVQQNLALVLGLGGKYEEAHSVAEAALPPGEASQNVAYLQKMASTKSAARNADKTADAATSPAARNASLPQATYQLGGPAPDK